MGHELCRPRMANVGRKGEEACFWSLNCRARHTNAYRASCTASSEHEKQRRRNEHSPLPPLCSLAAATDSCRLDAQEIPIANKRPGLHVDQVSDECCFNGQIEPQGGGKGQGQGAAQYVGKFTTTKEAPDGVNMKRSKLLAGPATSLRATTATLTC